MSTIHTIVKTMDGTAGGTISTSEGLGAELTWLQVAVSGRTTGTITVTAKTKGGHATEAFSGGLVIDLAAGEYTAYPTGAFESLTFAPSIAGDDFTVTVVQKA